VEGPEGNRGYVAALLRYLLEHRSEGDVFQRQVEEADAEIAAGVDPFDIPDPDADPLGLLPDDGIYGGRQVPRYIPGGGDEFLYPSGGIPQGAAVHNARLQDKIAGTARRPRRPTPPR